MKIKIGIRNYSNETMSINKEPSLDKIHLHTVRNLKLNFRLYDARHTFASRAVENGIDLLVLASILGHSSLKMIMRYAHPSEAFKADAIRSMETKRKGKSSLKLIERI